MIILIRVSPLLIRRRLKKLTAQVADVRQALCGSNHIEVFYEDLRQSRDQEIERILQHLGLHSDIPLTSNLLKLNPDKLEDILQNYAEVAVALRGTEFERYLD